MCNECYEGNGAVGAQGRDPDPGRLGSEEVSLEQSLQDVSVCKWVREGALRRMPLASGAGVEGVLERKWEAVSIRRSHRRSGFPAFVPGPAHILRPCSLVRIYLLSASQ